MSLEEAITRDRGEEKPFAVKGRAATSEKRA
jgi:hypothetical protein